MVENQLGQPSIVAIDSTNKVISASSITSGAGHHTVGQLFQLLHNNIPETQMLFSQLRTLENSAQ